MAVDRGMADFLVSYDGPAVEDGRMPVRDLAPSLLALAEIVQDANAVAAASPAVSLEIRAFGKGSFDVTLSLAVIAGILASNPVTAAGNVVTLTTSGLDLLRRIKSRGIAERTHVADNQTRIVLDDRTEIIAPGDAVTLVERQTFRRNARGFVGPLQRPGVDRLRIVVDGRSQLEVPANDVPAFEEPPATADRLSHETEARLVLLVASPSFIEGNKWRLSDGSNVEWYEMKDARFFSRVENGLEEFRSGDTLTCRVRFEQWREPLGGLRTDRQIVEVLGHSHYEEPSLFP